MTDRSGRRPPPTESEHARVLAEVLEDQQRRRQTQEAVARAQRPTGETSFFVQVALLVTGSLFFYLLFFSPTWITPGQAPTVTAEARIEGQRLYLYALQAQVERFREENQRLPQSLAELEGVREGTAYQRVGADDFQLSFGAGETAVTYSSWEDPATFLGDAGRRILAPLESSAPDPGTAAPPAPEGAQ